MSFFLTSSLRELIENPHPCPCTQCSPVRTQSYSDGGSVLPSLVSRGQRGLVCFPNQRRYAVCPESPRGERTPVHIYTQPHSRPSPPLPLRPRDCGRASLVPRNVHPPQVTTAAPLLPPSQWHVASWLLSTCATLCRADGGSSNRRFSNFSSLACTG